MKKMSILTVLVMLVTVTAYSVSGTYAKYTSKIDMTDEARVAKWELLLDGNKVTTEQNINLFAVSYSFKNDVYVQTLTAGENVVAPGTTGEYTFELSGNMETRFTLNVDLKTANDFMVYYGKDADGNLVISKTQTADATSEYHPLRYTIKKADGTLATGTKANMTFAELKAALAAYNNANSYEPGSFTKGYTISWVWEPINVEGTLTNDEVNALDTFMGENLSVTADKVEFNVTVTATQVTDTYAK